MSVAEAMEAAEKARKAFPIWAATGPNGRRACLMKAAAALEARAEDFVKR
jgi:acyl-CoA reductase-like NAD-dependent aldehyde dehydrogenase